MGGEAVIDITIPGVVWTDYLDPLATTMQSELALPEPDVRSFGRGFQYRYFSVPDVVALDLAAYLDDRADTLKAGIEEMANRERDICRSAKEAAARIRVQVRDQARPFPRATLDALKELTAEG